jgi:LysR family hca operon transcriptional activator
VTEADVHALDSVSPGSGPSASWQKLVNVTYDAETLSGGMSLVASTGSFTLLPLYVRNALIPSVVARHLRGEVPTIGLMMGYSKSNASPLLKRFLLRADELVNRICHGEAYSFTLERGDRKPSA